MRWLILASCIVCWSCSDLIVAEEPARVQFGPRFERKPRITREQREKFREQFEEAREDLAKLKRMTWKVGGESREALIHIPAVADKSTKLPIVFAFHGHGGRAEHVARKLAIHRHWPEAICVYPLGLPTPVPVIDVDGKHSGWQKYIGDQSDRDLQLFDAMLTTFRTDYAVDESRIYSTGHSNGGFFTYVLWAARGDTLAAVAPIAALVDQRDFQKYRPKPVLHVAGTGDRLVRFPAQERTIEQLQTLNGCQAEGKAIDMLTTEYSSKDGPPVVAYVHPGAHEIPDDAALRIARFFQQHTRPLPRDQ